jgi:hypothetical protein
VEQKHRWVIKKFVDDVNLKDVAVYGGYRGDIVLKMRTLDHGLAVKISSFCMVHNIECNMKHSRATAMYELFVIAEDKEVYPLKEPHFSLQRL